DGRGCERRRLHRGGGRRRRRLGRRRASEHRHVVAARGRERGQPGSVATGRARRGVAGVQLELSAAPSRTDGTSVSPAGAARKSRGENDMSQATMLVGTVCTALLYACTVRL